MLVVGSKPEYFNAVWVKNEWSRYLKIMKKDRKKLKKIIAITAIIVVAVAVVALAGTYFGNYFSVLSKAKNGGFDPNEHKLICPQITELHDENLIAY